MAVQSSGKHGGGLSRCFDEQHPGTDNAATRERMNSGTIQSKAQGLLSRRAMVETHSGMLANWLSTTSDISNEQRLSLRDLSSDLRGPAVKATRIRSGALGCRLL
jgi:hypothetical protein